MSRKLDAQADHLLWKQIVDKEDKVSFIKSNLFVIVEIQFAVSLSSLL